MALLFDLWISIRPLWWSASSLCDETRRCEYQLLLDGAYDDFIIVIISMNWMSVLADSSKIFHRQCRLFHLNPVMLELTYQPLLRWRILVDTEILYIDSCQTVEFCFFQFVMKLFFLSFVTGLVSKSADERQAAENCSGMAVCGRLCWSNICCFTAASGGQLSRNAILCAKSNDFPNACDVAVANSINCIQSLHVQLPLQSIPDPSSKSDRNSAASILIDSIEWASVH